MLYLKSQKLNPFYIP